jgi:hypothetical protein
MAVVAAAVATAADSVAVNSDTPSSSSSSSSAYLFRGCIKIVRAFIILIRWPEVQGSFFVPGKNLSVASFTVDRYKCETSCSTNKQPDMHC